MKKSILIFFVTVMTVNGLFAQGTEKEKVVRAYYTGFETHNWNLVASQLADGFTFTTPINDHISVKEFKDECWGTNRFTKKVHFIKWAQSRNDLVLLGGINTTDNKLVRNVDIYTFSGERIKSIEVFFGRGSKYPGNTE